jgi:hypothetical protein
MTVHSDPPTSPIKVPHRRLPRLPGQVVNCGWCGKFVAVPLRGRVPKWCSPACRHRAWEQRRAADSGLAAVDVVEQTVERPVRVEVPVPGPPAPAPPPLPAQFPKNAEEWARHLDQLAIVLDSGLMYNRSLPTLEPSLKRLVDAYNRRLRPRY